MSITHDYIAQELSRDRLAQLREEAAAARLISQVTRRPRGRPVTRPWWHRLRRTGSTVRPRPA
ncbi:MAG TPA: hypothetical protein VFH02_08360 [Jiangellaceae bacterium]|jgi:hypothetical protein|nr:hypothetical protein [Jiangellaceae bacterium]